MNNLMDDESGCICCCNLLWESREQRPVAPVASGNLACSLKALRHLSSAHAQQIVWVNEESSHGELGGSGMANLLGRWLSSLFIRCNSAKNYSILDSQGEKQRIVNSIKHVDITFWYSILVCSEDSML